MFRLLLASIFVLTSSIAKAQIEEEECYGDKYLSVESDDIWAGDFRVLYIGGGWADGYAHKSIGMLIGGGAQDWGEGAVCFSLSPFTTTNTNNGETCTNEGPFTVAADTTYYRMQIDRSQTPTRYCQILIKTGDTAPTAGETEVVTLDANGNNSGNVPDPDGPGDNNGPGGGGGGGGGGGNGQGRNQATPVPAMPMYLLMGLSGLLALFGFYRVRASK